MPFLLFRSARALRDLEERMSKLEREHRALELEAGELYEKTRHALGRVSKRNGSAPAADDGRPPGIDAKSWAIIQRRKPLVRPGGV